ncbi:TIGR03790 family protein [Duganella sp. FT92W]|uniref:TIGR03790 family protein n=1 Tax=Pseudoduganella rivuli TaxID=2666085 RepID=A0A7X2LVL9_9BURK|nr:TIGR03790 family protein [Pseudoduganella rivuli]MRV74192.1 TIGR03790 family protein [Pseudoduganella rivuli]
MLAVALAFLPAAHPARAQSPRLPTALQPPQLAVIVNDDDPDSVAIAEQYRARRAIPEENIVHVRIPGKPRKMDAAQFARLKQEIDSRLTSRIQAVLMAWTAPYAVECQGITAAYTLGFDPALCSKPCGPGKPSPYFNTPSRQPYTDFGMRISMLLPASERELATALIARGIAATAQAKPPRAGAYYVLTPDKARNSRAPFFPRPGMLKGKDVEMRVIQGAALENADDVLVYQIGAATVGKLDTVHFVPGALADHLTSLGGDLLGSTQMSSLRWLEAGATASYGAVSEPCNYWQKFPHPAVLLSRYVRGDSAIEAYWKSVAWPAQGVFIGEPLAAPYHN